MAIFKGDEKEKKGEVFLVESERYYYGKDYALDRTKAIKTAFFDEKKKQQAEVVLFRLVALKEITLKDENSPVEIERVVARRGEEVGWCDKQTLDRMKGTNIIIFGGNVKLANSELVADRNKLLIFGNVVVFNSHLVKDTKVCDNAIIEHSHILSSKVDKNAKVFSSKLVDCNVTDDVVIKNCFSLCAVNFEGDGVFYDIGHFFREPTPTHDFEIEGKKQTLPIDEYYFTVLEEKRKQADCKLFQNVTIRKEDFSNPQFFQAYTLKKMKERMQNQEKQEQPQKTF